MKRQAGKTKQEREATKAEYAIREALSILKALGEHPLLNEARASLEEADDYIAEFIASHDDPDELKQ